MALTLFGIDAEDVRQHHFPMWSAISASSKPTLAVVTEKIQEAAAEVAAALAMEEIDAASIVADSAAYMNCRKAVRISAALQLLWAASGVDPELAKAWREWLKDFYRKLDEGGATALGDGASSAGTSDPDGPTSHVSVFGLSTDSAADMSSTIPRLRKDDRL